MENLKLKVVESSWSEWPRDYKPKEKESLFDIRLATKYSVGSPNMIGGCFVFEITNIDDNGITIHTEQSYYGGENGIDLLDDRHDFVITAEKPLKLKTLTMDAGAIYYLSLVGE